MENICEVEKLNCIRNEMTHLWGSIFVLGGGAIALFLNGKTLTEYILASVGILCSIMMANAYFIRRTEVLKIVNKLKEKK